MFESESAEGRKDRRNISPFQLNEAPKFEEKNYRKKKKNQRKVRDKKETFIKKIIS